MEFLFAELRRREKTLRIHGTVPDYLRGELESAAAPYNVVVETAPSDATHTPEYDRDGDSVAGGDGTGDGDNGSDSYPSTGIWGGSIPDGLGRTLERFGLEPRVGVFEQCSRTEVRRFSRELARRASRRADGTFLGGVQWLSELSTDSDERRFYRRLARYGVDVTVCGVPDFPLKAEDVPFWVIADYRCDVVDYWFSLYDGAGVDSSKGVVVARQRPDGGFEGYWSYDARTVDWAIERLPAEYPRLGRAVST